jgi:hypothetical protein
MTSLEPRTYKVHRTWSPLLSLTYMPAGFLYSPTYSPSCNIQHHQQLQCPQPVMSLMLKVFTGPFRSLSEVNLLAWHPHF